MNNLSIIVHTRNEERNIRRCLESCRFADELIVADMASEDHTVAIAQTFTPNVLPVERVNPVDRARNAVLGKAPKPTGLLAISVTKLYGDGRQYEWIRTALKPGAMIGYSIYLYDLKP